MTRKDKSTIEELKSMEAPDLKVKVEEWRRELFGLRLNATTAHVKNYSQFKKLRKNIARGLTLLGQKDLEQPSMQTLAVK